MDIEKEVLQAIARAETTADDAAKMAGEGDTFAAVGR